MTQEQAAEIYCKYVNSIDPTYWSDIEAKQVAEELDHVISASTLLEAYNCIDWWDWEYSEYTLYDFVRKLRQQNGVIDPPADLAEVVYLKHIYNIVRKYVTKPYPETVLTSIQLIRNTINEYKQKTLE